ncbi:glycosyltransferase family 4 protein [Dolichospermum circinale]|uniref:glycosyltransferase family 4 protein n=1 Tax=Dolichospermum circinale TaxID=109265 RepID=UPI00232CF92A|nr:glycosyltransferase family 4 protein [Dolichospermum circinale]MDB9449953.1 glycosyltransferase family 4 protein [Dolichospermum circinale CS-547]
MKIAYSTAYDARSLTGSNEWSGLGYYISQTLKNQGIDMEYLGPLQEPYIFSIVQKCKRRYYKSFQHTHYEKDADLLVLKGYADQLSKKLVATNADVIFSATIRPIVYLDCHQPIVFWTDATCAGLVDFYPQYNNLCQESLENWQMMERLALQKCKLAIYASEWAAQTAIDYYNADPNKVKVVPFGANIDSSRNFSEIKDLIESRPSNKCKLLFLGVDWFRKGGDVALKVAEELNKLGLNTELTVVGCQPIVEGSLPSFVKPLGFISKSTNEGKERINQLLAESHFLILPSRAECYGVVFCEANSLGVPCISRKVGGIPTIIKPNVNGNLFDLNTEITEYCEYISRLFSNYSDYKNLALSSFNEYQSRLNWSVAGKTVQELLTTII